MYLKKIFGLFVLVLSLISCRTETLELPKSFSGEFYYPLKVGRFVIFSVDSTTFYLDGRRKKVTYFQKELITDSFPVISGQLKYILRVSKRYNNTQNWQSDSVWSLERNSQFAKRIQNNQILIELIFPIKSSSRWNPYLYRADGQNNTSLATVSRLGASFISGDSLFDNTVTVVFNKDSSCIDKNIFTRTFAKNYGLIYEKNIKLLYDNSSTPCAQSIDKIESGYIIEKKFVRSGQEYER